MQQLAAGTSRPSTNSPIFDNTINLPSRHSFKVASRSAAGVFASKCLAVIPASLNAAMMFLLCATLDAKQIVLRSWAYLTQCLIISPVICVLSMTAAASTAS